MKDTKVITLTSLKGGTGKTTVSFNIAALLALEYSKKCLVIDVDAQHNMTQLLSTKPSNGTELIFDSGFSSVVEAEDIISKTQIEELDLIGTSIKLTATEVQITSIAGRELIIKNWLEDNSKFLSRYDYVFFDTNPTMSIININALIASDSIILVSDIDIDSISAVDTFLELYYPIQHRIDRRNKGNVEGLLINKVQETTNMDSDFIEYVEADNFEYKDILLESMIHSAVSVRETKLDKYPIRKKRDKRVYKEFISLIEELKNRGVL